MTSLAVTGGIPPTLAMLYTACASLALSCHVKTSLTDPGSVPSAAVPTEAQRMSSKKLSMCSQCQTFKPPLSHHCRICNRCISRMSGLVSPQSNRSIELLHYPFISFKIFNTGTENRERRRRTWGRGGSSLRLQSRTGAPLDRETPLLPVARQPRS